MDITGVFEVLEEIPEIGALPGDRLVVRPHALRPGLLQRIVAPHWAFDRRCRLMFTRPHLPGDALRRLQDRLPRSPRPGHLRLL